MIKKTLTSFLKIGSIGFGGGSALIPIIEEEIVEKNAYIKAERYMEHTIVSNITPGALPVKLGALSGYDMSGIRGMLIGAFGVALPGVLVTVLLISLLSVLGDSVIHQIEYASVGISAFIVFLLYEYIHKVLKNAKKQGFFRPALVLLIVSAIVTCGKELRAICATLLGGQAWYSNTPILDISTIQLLLLAFFVIFYTCGKIRSGRMVIACGCSALYVLAFGKGDVLHSEAWRGWLMVVMLLLAGGALLHDARKETRGMELKRPDFAQLTRRVMAFAAVIAACSMLCYLFVGTVGDYVLKGLMSTVTSFGGGEAYLTVADGIFVGGGDLSASVYYGQIVPVANALPGPILVKILAGVGYSLGFSAGGVCSGYLMALTGFAIGVGGSCIVCLLIDTIYHSFSALRVFTALKQWILPVICGLLISTIMSMVLEMFSVGRAAGWPAACTLGLAAALFALACLLCKRFKWMDAAAIILMGSISVLAFNVL